MFQTNEKKIQNPVGKSLAGKKVVRHTNISEQLIYNYQFQMS